MPYEADVTEQSELEQAPTDAGLARLSFFDFTPEDLKSNQHGFISDQQRAYLQGIAGGIQRSSWSMVPVAVGFLLLGTCLILGMFMQNASTRAALFSSRLNLFLLAATAVVVLALVGFSVIWARRRAAGLSVAQLQSVEGPVHLQEDYSPRSSLTAYRLFVGGHRFTFAEDMSPLFHEGRTYRIYYCKSGVYEPVLSFEELKT